MPKLLEASARRADAQGLKNIAYQVADAEALPFGDESFDVVLSTFGVMFAPAHFNAATELVRVTRKGGIIAMANWTAGGFVGLLFEVLSRHIPPPAALPSPFILGSEDALAQMFKGQVTEIRTSLKTFTFRYRSTAHFIDMFRTNYGPIRMSFEALGKVSMSLEADIAALCERLNQSDDALIIPSEYAEVIILK